MAGEIQLNSTTMATESSGSITAELDTIRPNTTNGSLTLQGDSSDAGVTGLTIDSSGVVNTTTAKVTNIQATSGQSLTIKDEDGNAAITIGTDNTATSYLSLNFGSYHGGNGTLTANTLDDFEIGTWTPVFSPSGGGSFTLKNTVAKYTKIGGMVNVILKTQVDVITPTPSGRLGMTGMPFNSGSFPLTGTALVTGFSSFTGSPTLLIESGNTVNFDIFTGGTISASLANYVAANAYIYLNATYRIN